MTTPYQCPQCYQVMVKIGETFTCSLYRPNDSQRYRCPACHPGGDVIDVKIVRTLPGAIESLKVEGVVEV